MEESEMIDSPPEKLTLV